MRDTTRVINYLEFYSRQPISCSPTCFSCHSRSHNFGHKRLRANCRGIGNYRASFLQICNFKIRKYEPETMLHLRMPSQQVQEMEIVDRHKSNWYAQQNKEFTDMHALSPNVYHRLCVHISAWRQSKKKKHRNLSQIDVNGDQSIPCITVLYIFDPVHISKGLTIYLIEQSISAQKKGLFRIKFHSLVSFVTCEESKVYGLRFRFWYCENEDLYCTFWEWPCTEYLEHSFRKEKLLTLRCRHRVQKALSNRQRNLALVHSSQSKTCTHGSKGQFLKLSGGRC